MGTQTPPLRPAHVGLAGLRAANTHTLLPPALRTCTHEHPQSLFVRSPAQGSALVHLLPISDPASLPTHCAPFLPSPDSGSLLPPFSSPHRVIRDFGIISSQALVIDLRPSAIFGRCQAAIVFDPDPSHSESDTAIPNLAPPPSWDLEPPKTAPPTAPLTGGRTLANSQQPPAYTALGA